VNGADVWLVTRVDGGQVVAKTLSGAGDDVLPIEAAGLTVLCDRGGLGTWAGSGR
jgi:hypothetical protein